jgi:hypothetical protein
MSDAYSTAIASPSPNIRRRRPANGLRLFGDADLRTSRGRRFKELALSIADEAGGAGSLSDTRLSLVRVAATMLTEGEQLLTRAVAGERVDPSLLLRINAAAGAALDRLGLNKDRNHEPRPISGGL